MDIDDEWELLPDDGFLEIHDDGSGKKIFSRKYVNKHVFQMNNYFNISPDSSCRIRFDPPPSESNRRQSPNQLVPVQIQLEHLKSSDDKLPIELDLVVPSPNQVATTEATMVGSRSSNQDGVSQVFFKKENEFVDMKMDSPRSTASANNGIMRDLGVKKEDDQISWEEVGEEAIGGSGFNLWRWSLTGVGAICSFGIAAATICIIILTNHQKNKNQHNQKLRFQIYSDDKRINQVVQQATKLNEAISVARGVPLTRAHFTVGGYYDGL